MKWRLLLSLLLVIGMMSILFLTERGKGVLNFFQGGLGNFLKSIRLLEEEKEGINIKLTANLQSLSETFFINSEIFVEGTYDTLIVNDLYITTPEKTIEFNCLLDGEVEISGEEITIKGKTKSIASPYYFINGEKPMDIMLQIKPTHFSLKEVNKKKIVLKSATGEIVKKGGEKITTSFTNSDIEILDFRGSINITEDTVEFEGVVGGVRGANFRIE